MKARSSFAVQEKMAKTEMCKFHRSLDADILLVETSASLLVTSALLVETRTLVD